MQRYIFKEGEEIVHRDNPTLKMRVKRILRQTKKVPKPDGKIFLNPKTGLNEFEKIDKTFFVGLECTWWDKEGKFHKEIFHTKLLIPSHFATSKESILAFLGE